MAFDFVNDDPDHHHDQPGDDRFDEIAHLDFGAGHSSQSPPARKKWITEKTDDPFINHARGINIAAVAMATMAAPDDADDVDAHAAKLAVKIGGGKWAALLYCDVGIMLARMPRLKDFADAGVLPIAYLGKIADATVAISDGNLHAVETAILKYLAPRREYQALPGLRKFARELAAIVERIEPISTPPDEDEPKDSKESEGYSIDTQRPGDHGELMAHLRKDRMAEFEAIANAIYESERAAGRECTRGDVLMHMCRGTASAEITMNVYVDGACDKESVAVWLDGAGWLEDHVGREWLERCTHKRFSRDSHTPGYVPTDEQKARVRGRDGTCRFPGCDVPAHKCDIDHVINYDPRSKYVEGHPLLGGAKHTKGAFESAREMAELDLANKAPMGPVAGPVTGVTATWNLQCLCRHHHNMKTSRHFHAVMHDAGSVTWTSHDGELETTTVPSGPMAHIKRQTFGQRAARRTKIIRDGNHKRLRAKFDAIAAMEKADDDRAIREHARATKEFEAAFDEFIAGPQNSSDPEAAAEARAVAEALDDGWPLTPPDIEGDREKAPEPPDPLGPVPGIPF